MSADKTAGEPEPVDAEFEPADPPGNDPKTKASKPKKRGPGWIAFVFFVLLAAAIGGVTAWALERYAGPLLPELGFDRPVTAAPDMAPLEQRLAALEAREPETGEDPRVEALEARIAELEARPEPEPGEIDETALSDVRAEIDALRADMADLGAVTEDGAAELIETRLSELRDLVAEARTAANEAETQAQSALAAAEGRPAESAERLQSNFAELSQQVSDLRADLRGRFADFDAEREGLSSEMDALAADIAELRRAGPREGASPQAGRAAAYLLMAEAARSGEGFEDERAALERAWQGRSELRELRGPARSGVPSRAALLAAFPRETLESGEDGSDRVLFGLVTLRQSGEERDQARAAPRGEVEAALAAGDLDAAVRAAERADPIPGALESWLDGARARIALDAALADLRRALAEDMEGASR
ncbi:hypothetical protein FKB34_00230 [Glycocaulis profundi]|nr:hypothetical protein FKB34_00230 [Glycocaulis profundi]